ncbi:MAG TPA: LysM domain-containing protein, partial [Anaerolineae bacterium]|nr:LysM domain-containing protein [Anaerolineae bacterium]
MAIHFLKKLTFLFLLLFLLPIPLTTHAQTDPPPATHLVQPGDSWLALSFHYQLPITALQTANPHPNPYRQPTIGTEIRIPTGGTKQNGLIISPPHNHNIISLALAHNLNPWYLARLNNLTSPYDIPTTPLFVPTRDDIPRQYPPHFTTLNLATTPAQPGTPLALHGQLTTPITPTIQLLGHQQPANNWATFTNNHNLIALTGTGAFDPPG